MTRRSPHLTALAASLLALAVAAGVATPRLRSGGRERAARGAALAGSNRPDRPCAWVEPDDDFSLEIAALPGALIFDTRAVASGADVDHAAALPEAAVVPAPASIRLARRRLALHAGRSTGRSCTTRGPPAFLA